MLYTTASLAVLRTLNLSELLTESAEMGELKLAYSIMWAMQNKLVTGNSSFEDFLNCDLDHNEISRMQERNLLGLKLVSLYSSKLEDNQYVFIFAESSMAAKMFYKSLYGKSALNMTDASSRMDMEMWDANEGYITFREMKDRTLDFPAVALVYEKESKTTAQVEHEYFQMYGRKLLTNEEKQRELEKGDSLFF